MTTRTLEIVVNQTGNAASGISAIGVALGTTLGNAVTAGVSGVVNFFSTIGAAAFDLNSTMQNTATGIGGLLDGIASTAGESANSVGDGMTEAMQNASDRVRDIAERTQDSIASHAATVASLQEQIMEASSAGIEQRQQRLSETLANLAEQHQSRMNALQDQAATLEANYAEQKADRAQDFEDRVSDFTEDHLGKRAGLQNRLNEAILSGDQEKIAAARKALQEEDAEFNKQKQRMEEREAKAIARAERNHQKQVVALQKRIQQEEEEYRKQEAKQRELAARDLAGIRAANAKRVAELEARIAKENTAFEKQQRDLAQEAEKAAREMEKATKSSVQVIIDEMGKAAVSGEFANGIAFNNEALQAWLLDVSRDLPGTFKDTSKSAMQLMAYNLDPTRWLVPVKAIQAVFGAPEDQIVRAFGDLAAGATGIAVREFANLGVNLKAIPGLKFDAQGTLVTPIDEAMTIIEGFINTRFVNVMEESRNNWSRVIENITDIWDQFAAGLAKPVFDWVGEKLIAIRDALEGNPEILTSIQTRFGEMWAVVQPILDRWWGFAGDIATAFAEGGVQGAWDELVKIVTETSPGMVESFDSIKSAYDWIVKTIEEGKPIWDKFVADFNETIGPAMVIVRDSLNRISEALGGSSTKFSEANPVLVAFHGILDAAITAIKLGSVALWGISYVVEYLSGRVTAVKDLWNAVTGLGDGTKTLADRWGAFGDALVKFLIPAWLMPGSPTPLENGIRGIAAAADIARTAIERLANAVSAISLPDWLTPGSPTPFEIGLRGIANATGQVANVLPMAFAPNTMPALAGASGAAGIGMVNVAFTYAPTFSLASQMEAERVLKPVVEGVVRQALAGRK